MIPKNIYSLTFIQESKYKFKELSFKGYKNLGPRNNKIFFFILILQQLSLPPTVFHFSIWPSHTPYWFLMLYFTPDLVYCIKTSLIIKLNFVLVCRATLQIDTIKIIFWNRGSKGCALLCLVGFRHSAPLLPAFQPN